MGLEKRVSFEQNYALEFIQNIPSGYVDVVLAMNFFNYCAYEYSDILLEMTRVLRPGGGLYASVFAVGDEEHGLTASDKSSLCEGPFGTVRLFIAGEIEEMLPGFRVEQLWEDEYIDKPHIGAPFPHKNKFIRFVAKTHLRSGCK
jgi:SAM-dependent methyltransferase